MIKDISIFIFLQHYTTFWSMCSHVVGLSSSHRLHRSHLIVTVYQKMSHCLCSVTASYVTRDVSWSQIGSNYPKFGKICDFSVQIGSPIWKKRIFSILDKFDTLWGQTDITVLPSCTRVLSSSITHLWHYMIRRCQYASVKNYSRFLPMYCVIWLAHTLLPLPGVNNGLSLSGRFWTTYIKWHSTCPVLN